MEFSKIKIKRIDEIEDKAFRRASQVRIDKRKFQHIHPPQYRDLIIEKERTMSKISTFSNIIKNELTNIIHSFPIYENLSPFYQELLRSSVYIKKYKASLRNVAWVNRKIQEIAHHYIKKIKKEEDKSKLKDILKEFYGRSASLLKDIREEGEYLHDVKNILQRFPVIEEDKAIYVVAGAPNVGKSSLINALCEGNIETNTYPFTTKDLNIGKIENIIILVDTPGILEKSCEDMNTIEKKAFVAITKLPANLLYVFDVSLSSGYEFEKQKEIHESIRKHFRGDVIYILNKIDIKDDELFRRFKEYLRGKEVYEVSAQLGKGIEELKETIFKKGIADLSNKGPRYRERKLDF